MTRDFLQNFKIGEQVLPKEIIDSILDENGRDIEAAKKPYADYDAIKDRLKTAEDGLKAFDGVDITKLQGEISKLKGDLAKKDSDWQEKIDGMAFDTKALSLLIVDKEQFAEDAGLLKTVLADTAELEKRIGEIPSPCSFGSA